MNLTEIKKRLYKEKPKAHFLHLRKIREQAILVYGCCLDSEDGLPNIFFEIPVSELMDGLFGNTTEAQLLIRYIIQPESEENGV
jgi:hypothetical protein